MYGVAGLLHSGFDVYEAGWSKFMKIIRGYLDFAYSCTNVSLSFAPFLPVLHSLSPSSSLSIHERSSATSGRTLRSPLFCPRHVEISIRDAGLSNKVGDGEIVPADFVRLAHPEVPPRLCSTFRRTTRLALAFVYAARRPCRFQRRPLLRSVYGVILTTDWFNCTLATGSEL